MSFVFSLISKLESNSNSIEAARMQTYMKNKFIFLGIKAPTRKTLLKEVINEHKSELSRDQILNITNSLYKKPQRELHYCAIELVNRFLKNKYEVSDIGFIEHLITTNSWWDSVDFIAKHILGNFLLQFPDQIHSVIDTFSSSDNMWLNRSSILFQLGYKENTDSQLLYKLCDTHKASDEFFIKKAIGWALREYSKTNPESVVNFITMVKLKPLSEKEGLKRIRLF
ncbi:DNA alkylation repair protein [Aquimarina sediminis]|uniref:DNA alkylation repair protein n=1 Tax=Aquimarina sediminis TaxID=2070536 RepID=UPI000CA02235|nr:DNA alkylation repair protein [Aquimarina sediminis]